MQFSFLILLLFQILAILFVINFVLLAFSLSGVPPIFGHIIKILSLCSRAIVDLHLEILISLPTLGM